MRTRQSGGLPDSAGQIPHLPRPLIVAVLSALAIVPLLWLGLALANAAALGPAAWWATEGLRWLLPITAMWILMIGSIVLIIRRVHASAIRTP